MSQVNIHWFRRDLRIHDNAALYHALKRNQPVLGIFIFDECILEKLEDKADPRVSFIYQSIENLKKELQELGSDLYVSFGKPDVVWKKILNEFRIGTVFTNRDYEPYAVQRDQNISELLEKNGIDFKSFKDQVIFEKGEILKKDGSPYTVFTPYSRKWLEKLNSREAIGKRSKSSYFFQSYPNEKYFSRFLSIDDLPIPKLEDLGFDRTSLKFPPKEVKRSLVKNYEQTRNFPGMSGTSRLGVHFRFGTISIREKARKAMTISPIFLNELIWRDFYSQILAHFPHVVEGAFRSKYDRIPWRNNEQEFEAWCQGKTGYPIVDAGMRELNFTGFMHNRVRMITASFLTKHLLIDWRWGEAYFAQKLLDFDLASNNGGWQWAAGSGTDAAPYFRIFNPYTQATKFDKEGAYVAAWVPELKTGDYPEPIVDHKFARQRCLKVYKEALG
ncbi:MAG: deoxyribodipyrimidine photo-lyase [Saprospiraceae bacterium]|nr:deoxyribodipyrimidine photo-lyase [Saprospiraceae bacterium]